MNNILAAHVLMSHLQEIKDRAYKTAIEIAIETLFQDAMYDWYTLDTKLSAAEYLGITHKEYEYWLMGDRETHGDFK